MRIHAYPRFLRPALAAAEALAAGNLVVVAANVAWSAARAEVRLPPAPLLMNLVALTLGPWLAVALLRAAASGTATVEGGALHLGLRGRRIEIPRAALATIRHWRVPLPAPGVSLRMVAGQPFRLALEVDDPGQLLEDLGEPPGLAWSRVATWARARISLRPRLVERVARWVLLPLLPAAVLFHLHQAIAYGGALGEWRLLGFTAWFRTLLAYWAAALAFLVLPAAATRVVAELLCAATTVIAPRRAAAARRGAEWLCRAILYGGVPALLAIRFLA